MWMQPKKTKFSKQSWNKKNKAEVLCSLISLCYKVTIIKRILYWHKSRHIYKWKRIGSPEINIYGQLICDKRGKNIQWRKIVSSISGIGKTGQLLIKKKIILHTTYKIKLKDLNVRQDIITFIEQYISCNTLS